MFTRMLINRYIDYTVAYLGGALLYSLWYTHGFVVFCLTFVAIITGSFCFLDSFGWFNIIWVNRTNVGKHVCILYVFGSIVFISIYVNLKFTHARTYMSVYMHADVIILFLLIFGRNVKAYFCSPSFCSLHPLLLVMPRRVWFSWLW